MAQSLKKRLWEFFRCTRHNWLHLNIFRVRFDGDVWHVTDAEGLELRFPFYPYLVFYEIEGYLRQGKWKLEEGMTVIDGGACYGEFSLYASRKVGKSGRVIMLEPDPANVRQAHEYFAFNGGKPDNIEIIQAGLWKSAGVLKFVSGLGSASLILSPGEPVPAGGDVTEIIVESLESLAGKLNLNRMDLVKLDIEGAEVEVAESSADILRKFRPKFSIASYHMRGAQMTCEVIEPLFQKLGYRTETGFFSHRTTWAEPAV